MSTRGRAVTQRITNQGHTRKLARTDAFVAYAIDRFLFRLGRSRHAREFYLKGGVLVANIAGARHRFTRDIDFLRRRGPPDPDDLRDRLGEIAAVVHDDGIVFDADRVRTAVARREEDGYDGVKATLVARVDLTRIEVLIDVGFGDAVVPPPRRTPLLPFLSDDPPAVVYAYPVESVLAEKIEAVLFKFPLIAHRLKDVLDVVALAPAADRARAKRSLLATLERRGKLPGALTRIAPILGDMRGELRGRKWSTAWAKMCAEKRVITPIELHDALAAFDAYVRTLLE